MKSNLIETVFKLFLQEGESSVMAFTGEILDRNYHVWKGALNRNAFNKVKEIFVSGYERFSHAIKEVASDKNHPLNAIVEPALKMTLYDYWKSLKAQVKYSSKFILLNVCLTICSSSSNHVV